MAAAQVDEFEVHRLFDLGLPTGSAGGGDDRHSGEKTRVIACKTSIRSMGAVLALAGALLLTCGTAAAQETASIMVLPSATPTTTDRVVARITHFQAFGCYTFTPAVTPLPGGVFEVRYTVVGALQPFNCTQTFDIDLGVLPPGNYTVRFITNVVLAAASFTVSISSIPVPTISEWGVAILAILVAAVAMLYGRWRGGGKEAVGRRHLGLLLAGCLTFFGTPGSVSKAVAAEIAPRATLTDLVVRFDRRVETRSVREIVDAVNAGRDAVLSSRPITNPGGAWQLVAP